MGAFLWLLTGSGAGSGLFHSQQLSALRAFGLAHLDRFLVKVGFTDWINQPCWILALSTLDETGFLHAFGNVPHRPANHKVGPLVLFGMIAIETLLIV